MKRSIVLACVTLLLSAAAVTAAAAGEAKSRTLEGKIVCAKCTLQVEGQAGCQNVLVVEKNGKTKQFYLTRNAVSEKFGEVCKATPAVRVTGEVSRDAGRAWVTATKITPLDDKG